MQEFIVDHWPFFVMAAAFWVIGHFMETSVFTKDRVRENHPESHGAPPRVKGKKWSWKDTRSFGEKMHHWFFYWMRESMELHPMIAGAIVGTIWTNPEQADPAWDMAFSVGYFLGAGVLSLFFWLVLTKILEKLGIKGKVRMPGESEPPGPTSK